MNTKQEQHLASLLQAAHKIAVHVLATSFAGLCCFLAKECRGPGIISHVCDVNGRIVVERS